jgi:hypothetical protein
MADIKVACPGCSYVYDLPGEYAGQVGECTECGATFVIPEPTETAPAQEPSDARPTPSTEEQPPSEEQAPAESQEVSTDTAAGIVYDIEEEGPTNTVKLSRASIGMLPDVDDQFNVNVVNKEEKPAPPQAPAPSPMSSTKIKNPRKTFKNVKPKAKFAPKPRKKKKWWQSIFFWK